MRLWRQEDREDPSGEQDPWWLEAPGVAHPCAQPVAGRSPAAPPTGPPGFVAMGPDTPGGSGLSGICDPQGQAVDSITKYIQGRRQGRPSEEAQSKMSVSKGTRW